LAFITTSETGSNDIQEKQDLGETNVVITVPLAQFAAPSTTPQVIFSTLAAPLRPRLDFLPTFKETNFRERQSRERYFTGLEDSTAHQRFWATKRWQSQNQDTPQARKPTTIWNPATMHTRQEALRSALDKFGRFHLGRDSTETLDELDEQRLAEIDLALDQFESDSPWDAS
jgi:hypothetical protein